MGNDKKEPAQAMSGRGSLGGGAHANAVDVDKVWRDRIRQEHLLARNFEKEYSFLVSSPSTARSTSRRNNANNNNENDSPASNNSNNSPSNNSNSASSSAEREHHSAELCATLLHPSAAVGTTAATVPLEEISDSDMLTLMKELQRAQYTSTAQASYKPITRRLELGGTVGGAAPVRGKPKW